MCAHFHSDILCTTAVSHLQHMAGGRDSFGHPGSSVEGDPAAESHQIGERQWRCPAIWTPGTGGGWSHC